MHRIDTATKAVDLFGPGKHGFRDGNVGTGVQATKLNAKMWNMVVESLCRLVELSGIALDDADYDQLFDAVVAIVAAQLGGDVAYLNVAQTFTKAKGFQQVVLADTSTVAVDLSQSNAFIFSPTASRTLGDPSGIAGIRCGIIEVHQPVGGNCGLSTHANWVTENDDPIALTLTPNAIDVLVYLTLGNGKVFLTKRENLL